MITDFSEMNVDGFNDDFERAAFNRQRAEVLSSAFLYDEDEEARARVDADDYASVYRMPSMRDDDCLHVLGRDLALTVDTDLADMPMDLAQRAIERVEDEGRRKGYSERLAQLGAKGGDTAQDYYRLYAQVQRDNVQLPYREHVAKVEERKAGLTGLFGELVAAGGFKAPEAWAKFDSGFDRGVYTADDKESIDRAADAWGMMRGMVKEYADAGANVLAQASIGGLIMERLRGDELAEALFFAQLQTHIQDMKTSAEERNFFVRFAQAFEAADKTLMAGMLGGHFKAFVTDEQVDDYNKELERAREISGLENPNVPFYAEGDNWAEKYLGLQNARLGAVHSAARQSGQLNEDGSLRKMTEEERRGTQELNAFRGKLFNATQGMYDIDGFAAKFGKMLPSSALYLVPGGVFASAASMYTQDLAQQLGEGESWTGASNRAVVNAAIQAGVEKIAFGSLKAGKMVPGMDWLMSRQVMARTLGGLYGTTAGRIGMGAVVGAAEETFVEPLAGLLLSGAYNAVASDAIDLDDPVAEWRKEMAEMLEPDQLLATAVYGLLLGGVSYAGQREAALNYRDVRERLMAIGVDEGRAAQVARIENPVERRVAEQALVNERLKTDSKGVLAYVAELYPQLQPMATVENYIDRNLLPRILPAGDGQVKVQEKDENGEVTETIMSEATARLLVESRLEELSGKEQAEMADMVLANAMVGSLSKDGARWVVSPEAEKMNHEYFQRLARAAGLRLSEGARPEDVDPEVHPHIPLGQLAQQGKAWESRMKVARHDYEQKLGHPVSDEEWARVSETYGSRVNRTGVRGADKRLRTVLRVARGGFGAMEVLEDVTEDNLVRDMEEHGRTLDYYISNLRELEGALGKPGAFLRDLKDGETEGDRRMAVIEAMGKLVQSKVLADTAKSGNKLSAALNAFLDLIRSWVLQAKAMFKLGEAVNTVLTNPEAAAKMDKEFREDVERLVAQDVEFLQNIQLADGLEAMQRVYEAHDKAKADRKVKRRKRAKTPVLDAAVEAHGEEVRKEQAEKEKTQAEVQADVEAAEAAVDGDFSASVVNEDELDAIKTAAEKDGTFMKAPNGKPTNLTERQWLQVRTKAFKEWFGDWKSAAYMQYFRNRLLGLLTPEMMQGVAGKGYHDIKGMGLDTRVRPMAYIPMEIAKLMGDYVVDNLIYGSDFRFVEHVANHHAEVHDYAAYVDNMLEAFAHPDKVFFDTKNQSYLFAKGEKAYFLSVVRAPGHEERYIQWKTAYQGREIKADRYKEIWKKGKVEPVDANSHDKGPTQNESPSAQLSDLGSKRSIKEVVRDVKPENVSKVVDENGEPLVVTHATNAEPFTVFHRGERAGLSGKGIYFSPDGVGIWGKNIMRCFLNVRNPLTKENAPREVNNGGMSAVVPDVFEKFPEFDGVMIRRDEITVRDPEQIKSATDNRGTFDGSSDDITLSVTDARESGLFEDGMMEARNAIVVAPDASFSVKALHVSPHKFRKFSTNHMGTGEGHQAFGWGLYFMTNAEVNRHYYGMFSGYEESYLLGGQAVDYYEFERKIGSILLKHGGDELYLGELRRVVVELHELPAHKLKATKLTRNRSRKYLQAYRAALKEIAELGLGVEKINKPATNYRVELNVDDSNLLMFDEAVPAELHEAVKALEGGRSSGLVIQMPEASKETWPGYRIYNELTRKLGSAKTASEWLAERGVKGIKYLDGGSRSAGEGSYNYVIFSGDDVKITGVNETGDYKAPWDEYEDVDASFNVIGPSAKTWDKYEDSRKFKGRDDGKERVEIDASRAKLTSRAFLGDAGDEYRLLVAGKAMPFGVQDDLEKLREQQKLIDGWYHILFETDDVDKAQEYSHEHGMTQEWWAVNTALLKNVKEFVIRQLQLAGVTGEGKYGTLIQSNGKLMGLVMESLISGKVNEDVAAELDKMSGGNMKCLKDVLDYEELYEAYPDLKWLPVSVADLGYELRGRLFVKGGYPDSIELNVRLDADGRRSTLLHEIQHAIQTIEEFARGGTAEMASKLLEKQVRQYRIRLEHLRHEQRWLYAVDTAKDHLQRMLRLLKRPRAILKMGERFAVHEMQHVPTMAAQAIEMMWKEYTEIAMRDYGDSVAYAPGDGYRLPGHGDKKPTLMAVEELLEKLKALPSRRAGTLRGRRQKVEAEIERLYEENKHKLNMTDMSGSELYRRLAGEIEARNVQERRNWTEAERAARPFNETLEYPGEALVSFSVIGPKAETFDQYADRMFRGRDDGLPRAEIDASKAELKMKLKPEAERTSNVRLLHDKLRVYANGLAEYDKFKPVQRLWLLLQSRLTKGMRLSESEDWQRLKGFVCGDVEPVEFLGQIGLSEESSIDDIKAAYLKAESDLHETLSEFVAEENVSAEVFDAAFKVLLGGGNMALTPDDWEGKGETLGDILDYEELYAAYPDMRDIRMEYRSGGSSARASDTGLADAKIILGVNKTPEKLRGSLLHEIQHLIQLHEDFAFGGTPSNVGRIFGRLGRDAELTDRGDHDYKRLSGEIEARAVSRRQYMSEAERAGLPFNEAMEYPGEALTYRPSEFYATFDTTMSAVHVPLYHEILDTFEQRIGKDGSAVWVSKKENDGLMVICPYPEVLNAIIPWKRDVIASQDVVKKLMNKHSLQPQDVAKLPQALWNPVAVFEDPKANKGFIVITDILAPNITPRRKNKGAIGQQSRQMKQVMVVLELRTDTNNMMVTDVVSAYSADSTEKYKALLKGGYLRYADKERALLWASAEGDSILQLRTTALLHSGSGVMLKENLQNVNTDFTSSVVNLDERALAYEVVAAGQGFRANLAFSEQIVREMRGALLRMKKLGSKTATEREDAIAAMGTMVQVVKAAVAYLPQGYRFSVHPYLNKLEVLAELATTGDLKMTRDMANKTIKEWLKLNQGIDEVVAVKGQELDRQTSATELAKDYGEMQLQEAMEAIMHRVAGQLRKHAKDRAVLKIKELVERLAPKKDPKTGKLKGGKMSADAYRDLEDVAKAMNMDAEELEAKLAALRAEMEKPGIDEERRAQLESEMTLYDQFGDLKSMTAEEAVEALEALRQRVWFHRFEWDNVQAERRAARRAMVRSVVDGVGDVGQNEYNAKKRAKKPTQRLKNLADILSGMPAVLTGLRGYLPLHKLADDLARRANRAGEAIKKWEAERWVALEALSRETLGKSWRKSMDFMHEVLPTGVTFNRPKYRSVSVKTAALRELLAMTPEERRAEMNRRRDAGGLEAESVLTERDIEELEKQLLAMEEAGKVLSTVEARYVASVQREENLQLSRGEALYAILMWEQPTYTERMEAQGYTPEVIAGFKRFIGDGMLQFGYGLRELFARQGERIARVYEATFGVPFPREENYFAARWNVTGMKENPAEQLLAGMAGTPGAGNGWMKQRVNHNLELDMTKDALQVFLQATTLTDTWMATQDIVADFKAWTRDQDFDRAMTSVLGKDDYENLKDWIRIVEQGGVQDCLNMGVAQDVINGLYGSGAVAILGFRIQTLLRQLPSIFNGLLGAHDISAGEWLATLSRMKKAEAPMTYKRMMNSTLIQNRRQGKAGNMAGQAMRSNDTDSSMSEGMLLASMLPMEWVDASCTAMSLVPVWNVYYQRAIDKGASVQEAEQAAWEQTTIVANLASQPIGWLNKSKIAQSRNPLVKAVFYMLSENTAKFAMCRALWRGGKKKAALRAWLLYGAANAVISALLDALQGDPEEFEKGKWWEYVLSAIYGPLASIPGVGEAVEALGTLVLNVTGEALDIDELKKARTRASVGRAMLDVQGFVKAWTKIYGYMTDDEEHSLAEYTRAASTISRTMAIGTGWMGNALGYWSTVVAVLMNPIDFGARVWRNMKHYFD